ncbi:MAG TPA: hypothetical protein VF516_24165 [Kofleriaceae bacterium]
MQMRHLWTLAALGAAACGGVLGCGGCSSPRGAMTPPPQGDGGGGGPDGNNPDGNNPDGPCAPSRLPPGGLAKGPLRVDPANPRYFTAGNGAVYLTGAHTWGNFKDRAAVDPPPAFDYSAYLDFLVVHHHNFFRLWTWEQPHSSDNVLLYFTPFAWPRVPRTTPASDGKPPFDLDQFDQAYFDRLCTRVLEARDRGIYVSVMLFDGWDLRNGYNAAGGFPMAKNNNVNGVAATPDQFLSLSNKDITARQEAYVRKVIDTVNGLDNVLYEIANETADSTAEIAWQYHMVDYVKSYEKTKPKQHPVGMTSTFPGTDTDLYASNADWISPNAQLASGDGRKVVLNDTDHSYGWVPLQGAGPLGQRQWVWQTFCLGGAPVFMDPYLETWDVRNTPKPPALDPQWSTIRDAIGDTAVYANKLDLERAVPSPSLCSTGYCLAQPGHQYLVYQPGSGTFQLTVTAGTYHLEWYDPLARQASDGGTKSLSPGQQPFTPPGFASDAVLLLSLVP